jgi:hypothetical protein
MPGVSGTIGNTSFSYSVMTVTAIGDTASRFETSWYPSAFFVVASSLELDISGVGTATFLDPGAYGGRGFVFVIQNPLYESEAYVGFGSNQDHGRVSNSVLSTYDLTSPIAVSGNYAVNFDPAYYEQMTTLGLLTMLSSGEGTFTATLVPDHSGPPFEPPGPPPDVPPVGVPECGSTLTYLTVALGTVVLAAWKWRT